MQPQSKEKKIILLRGNRVVESVNYLILYIGTYQTSSFACFEDGI